MVTFASVYLIEKCQTQQEKNGDISGLIFRLSYVPESGALVAYFIAPTQLHFFFLLTRLDSKFHFRSIS